MSVVTTASATWIGRTGMSARRRVVGLPRKGVRLWPVVLGAVFVMAICCALVWIRLQAVRIGYRLSTARGVEQFLDNEESELATELATVTSPRRLERLASTRLGMRAPEPDQIVNVR